MRSFELGESLEGDFSHLHDLICDPIGIVVIVIIVITLLFAWILGVFVLSCCLILLHTYLQTDGLHSSSFCCCGQVGSEEEEGKEEKGRMAEDSTSTRRASTGVC